MKNSFCRICRGRFNLKYPPAAVDSEDKKNILAARIAESGEISDNICWDCEDTLLGFHKSVGEDNDEEEPVVVDDDEILYKTLEKSKRNRCLAKTTEIIQIDSSDSDPEELVIVPQKDDIISVEPASRIVKENCLNNKKDKRTAKNNKFTAMNTKIDNIPRGRVFESTNCPVCPYNSGVEVEIVYHIRQTHPQYNGDTLRFVTREGDSKLTRRLIFAFLWTFFECIECGKIHESFWPHRKHISSHDRKNPKDARLTMNNNKILNTNKNIIIKIQNAKRALEEINGIKKMNSYSQAKEIKKSHFNKDKTLIIKLHKTDQKTITKKQQNQNEKNNLNGVTRKQELQKARNERKRQKRAEARLALLKKSKKSLKPTFKMPQQPAPRASSIAKAIVQQQKQLNSVCKFCPETFPSFVRWNDHMMTNHSEIEFQKITTSPGNVCKKCDKKFKDDNDLKTHIRLSHRRKNRFVEINGNDDKKETCCRNITKENIPKEQIQSTDSLPFSNNFPFPIAPSTSFSPKSALLCQYCGFLFSNFNSMQEHVSTHVTNGDAKRIFVRNAQT